MLVKHCKTCCAVLLSMCLLATLFLPDFSAMAATDVTALHVSGGSANGASVNVPVEAGTEYTFSMYWKSDYIMPAAYVNNVCIVSGSTAKEPANFDPKTGLLTYTFTPDAGTVDFTVNTYGGGELVGDVHFYIAEVTLTKTADGSVTNIPVTQLAAWYGGINLEIIPMNKADFVVPVMQVTSLHVWGGTQNGASVQVPVENGVDYTLSLYWKSDYTTPGFYVGKTTIIAGNTLRDEAADFEPKSGLLTYSFTASGETVDIGVNTFAGGELTGDVHCYIADLKLTKASDGSAIDISVNQLTAWYGGINLEVIEMPKDDFVASFDGVDTLHVWGGTQNGFHIADIPVETGEEYTLTMYWRTDYATPRVYVGNTDIIQGWTAMNEALFDYDSGLLTYTFKATDASVSIGTATYSDATVAMDDVVHYYLAEPKLTKVADETVTPLKISEWTAWYGGINSETISNTIDFFVSKVEPPSVQAGHIWTSAAGGAYSCDVPLVKGNRYTFSLRWLPQKGSTSSVKLWQGSEFTQIIEGNHVQKGALFDANTCILTYTFVAKEEKFHVNCDAYDANGNIDIADGDVEFYFAEPSLVCLTDESNLDVSLANWQRYDANYEEVKKRIADFVTEVKEEDREKPIIHMLAGARVRYVSPAVLRFETEVSGLETLTAIGATYKIGTIIVPSDKVADIDFTMDALDANAIDYTDIPVTSWVSQPEEDNGVYLSYADYTVTNETDYTRTYAARTYVKVTYADGLMRCYWSKYTPKDNARSVYYVSEKAYTKPAYLFSDIQKAGLETYINAVKNDKKQVMYIDWDESTRLLQVAQNYSVTEDYVMIMKPQSINEIFNIAPGKFLKDTNGVVSANIADAYWRNNASFVESDWFGPHYLNYDWTGGTHGAANNTMPTGRTKSVALKVDGVTVSGDVQTYAKNLQIDWINELYHTGTSDPVLLEKYTMTFDGRIWDVHCDIEFVDDVDVWNAYYGIQCVYGYWCDNIRFDGGEPQTINVAGSGSQAYIVNSNIKKCETMTVNKGSDWLEMYIDSTYGIGDRRYLGNDNGAFAINYGGPSSGKAYFSLVGGGADPSMNAGDVVSYRGHYRFYSE